VFVLTLLGACTDSSSHATTPTSAPVATRLEPTNTLNTVASGLEPADYAAPAAGVCPGVTNGVGIVALNDTDHIPEPRCMIIRPGERLGVANHAREPSTVELGAHYSAKVAPGQSYVFDLAPSQVLAPGVHSLRAKGGSADGEVAEIWVTPS
jgi:hypothetical protein